MKLSQIAGQQKVKSQIQKWVASKQIPHAILFSGPEGNGSLALALAFVQRLFCRQPTDEDSCGNCQSCRKISSLQHPDVHFSFPFFNKTGPEKTVASDYWNEWMEAVIKNPYITIDQWRNELTSDNKQLIISVYEAHQIIQKLSLKSFEGKYKVQIIWMAEFLKPDSANTLLKILEEPPQGTIFILLAVNTEEMLPTILSRVQTVRVPAIDDDEMRLALAEHFPDCNIDEVCHFAAGDWNRARLMAQEENTYGAYFNIFQDWMRTAFKKDMVAVMKWSEAMHALPREDQKQFLRYAMDQIRQNLMLNYAGADIVRMNRDEHSFSAKFAKYINDHNALQFYSLMQDAFLDISRNAYSKLVFVDLSIKVHYLFLKSTIQ